jgi:hypothetical protein
MRMSVYSVAEGIMLDCRDPHMRVVWSSVVWGSLPLEGGMEVRHSSELKQLERKKDKKRGDGRYEKPENGYRRLVNPVTTANAFASKRLLIRHLCDE